MGMYEKHFTMSIMLVWSKDQALSTSPPSKTASGSSEA